MFLYFLVKLLSQGILTSTQKMTKMQRETELDNIAIIMYLSTIKLRTFQIIDVDWHGDWTTQYLFIYFCPIASILTAQ